jgi:beta-1,4-mannosyltransferase
VIVLGDLGRSPRMQYHALALAEHQAQVDVVAYAGTAPLAALHEHPRIRLHLFPPPVLSQRTVLPPGVVILVMGLRVFQDLLRFLWLMSLRMPKPDFILVQNPPAIPTLLIGLVMARACAAKLVIDWHNFSCSMLGLKLNQSNPILWIARWCEGILGRCGDAHLCVSEAMRAELAEHWGIHGAIVLYDRPAAHFAHVPPDAAQDFFRRIGARLDFHHSERRPILIAYPTSWTADEDFPLLLAAANSCDELIRSHDRRDPDHPFTHLLIVVTGKGPLRQQYEEKLTRLHLAKVHLRMLWLTPEDYPLMVGSADLGLCCHRSSSGFDLPMKVADLMGAGVPVLALNYGACLAEQVRDGENGLLFGSAEQLATQLYELFKDFPATPVLDRLRDNVRRLPPTRWGDGWKATAAPIFGLR